MYDIKKTFQNLEKSHKSKALAKKAGKSQEQLKKEHWEKLGKKEYSALTRKVNKENKQNNFHGIIKIH